ncbi:Hsp20/alpha crystallin family protein [Patescibacteria group bacterium]|nr:Hsp20/alpha crystallin family protein [Patescibacteria group bacterium]
MTDLVRRDPFRSIFSWPHWLDEFEATFPTLTTQRGLRIHETEKDILIEAVVAGVPSDDVEVHIEETLFRSKAEKGREEKGVDEYKSSNFQYYYTCALSGGQWDKASAEVENGVVTVTVPKTEAAKPRKITVKAKPKK